MTFLFGLRLQSMPTVEHDMCCAVKRNDSFQALTFARHATMRLQNDPGHGTAGTVDPFGASSYPRLQRNPTLRWNVRFHHFPINPRGKEFFGKF